MNNVLIQGKRLTDRTIVQEIKTSDIGFLYTLDGIAALIEEGVYLSTNAQDVSVSNGANFDLLVVTPTTVEVSMFGTYAAGGDATLSIYEGTTVSVLGTPITPINQNRNFPDVASTDFYLAPTVTTLGNLILTRFLPGGSGPHAGGIASRATRAILLPGINYLVRLTNDAGTSQIMGMQLSFTEVVL